MTRKPHDQFAKEYLEELLSLLGQVETAREVASEVREIDVYFVPTSPPPTNPKTLGLLGKMAYCLPIRAISQPAQSPRDLSRNQVFWKTWFLVKLCY